MNVICVSAVEFTMTGIPARILHCCFLNGQFRGGLIQGWHLFFIINFFTILQPRYVSLSPSWDRREEGKEDRVKIYVEAYFLEEVQTEKFSRTSSLVIKWNWNDSPLHNSKISSPTWTSCLVTTMFIPASGGGEENSFYFAPVSAFYERSLENHICDFIHKKKNLFMH